MKKIILLCALFIKSLLAMEEVLIDNEITEKPPLEQSIINGDAYSVYRLLISNNYDKAALKSAANIAEKHGYHYLAKKLRKYKKSPWKNVHKIHKECQKNKADNDIVFAISHGDIKTIDYLFNLYPDLWDNEKDWYQIAQNAHYETLAKSLLGQIQWEQRNEKQLAKIINDINYNKIIELYKNIDNNINNLNKIIMLINYRILKKLSKEKFYNDLLTKLKDKLIYLFISNETIVNTKEIWPYLDKKNLCININELLIDNQDINSKDIKKIFKAVNKQKLFDIIDIIEKKPNLIKATYDNQNLADIALKQNQIILSIALSDPRLWFAFDKYKMLRIIASDIACKHLNEFGM